MRAHMLVVAAAGLMAGAAPAAAKMFCRNDACCGPGTPAAPEIYPGGTSVGLPPSPTVYVVLERLPGNPTRGLREVSARTLGGEAVPTRISQVRDDEAMAIYRVDVEHPGPTPVRFELTDSAGCHGPRMLCDGIDRGIYEIAHRRAPPVPNHVTTLELEDGLLVVALRVPGAVYRVEWDTDRSAALHAPLPHRRVAPPSLDDRLVLGRIAEIEPDGWSPTDDLGIDLASVTRLRIVSLLTDGTEATTPVMDGAALVAAGRSMVGEAAAEPPAPTDAAIARTARWSFLALASYFALGGALGLVGVVAWRRRRRRVAAVES